MTLKVLHAADLHLDSPLRGLETYDGAPLDEVRRATRRALGALVDHALSEGVQLVLLAGDLYDGDFRDFSTGLYFVEQMKRLADAGAKVVWIRGNHDAESRMTRHLRLPPQIRELRTADPETVEFADLGIAIHGQGYLTRDITANLALSYPRPRADLLNIGLLHTALDGREGHMPYAPCALEQLISHGYDYWALGHVHAHEVLSKEPYVVFPGNLQGRHIRETGPKGAMVFSIEGGKISEPRLRDLSVVRWEQIVVDCSETPSLEAVLEEVARALRSAVHQASGRTLACRVILTGSTSLHGSLQSSDRLLDEVRAVGIEVGAVYVEKVQVRTRGALIAGALLGRGDALGDIFRALARASESEELLGLLRQKLQRELAGLPQEIVVPELDALAEIVGEATEYLEGRLSSDAAEEASK